jgi:hypothetical protein
MRNPIQKKPAVKQTPVKKSALLKITPDAVANISRNKDEDEMEHIFLDFHDNQKRPLFCLEVNGCGIDEDTDECFQFSSCCALGECGAINVRLSAHESRCIIEKYLDDLYEGDGMDGPDYDADNPYNFNTFESLRPNLKKFLDAMSPAMRTRMADLILSEVSSNVAKNLVLSVPVKKTVRGEYFTYFLVDNASNMRKGPVILSNDGLREIQTYIWSVRLPGQPKKV